MSDYHSAFYDKAREMIPEFLYEQIKAAAIPAAGAGARWRHSTPSIFERIAIAELRDDKLAAYSPKDLKNVLRRINKIYTSAKRAKEETGPYVTAAHMVVKAMRDRKLSVDAKLAVLQEFVGKSDEEIAKNLEAEVQRSAPTSDRGYTAPETMNIAQEKGKFTQEGAGYVPRSHSSYRACGGCRFFLRSESGEVGRCQVVDGPINWMGTSDLYIGADAEATYVFSMAQRQVQDAMMDAAMGVSKSVGGGSSNQDENTDPQKPKMTITAKEAIAKRIKQDGDEYVVTSDDGSKELGRHKSRAAAIRQLQAVEANKKTEKSGPTVNQVHQAGSGKKDDDYTAKRDKDDYSVEKEAIEREVPIAKVDEDQQKIYGIVLEPDVIDTQGDTMTAAEIEKAAETFMKSRVIGERHRKAASDVELTDNYVTQGATKIGNTSVKKGTWIIGVKVLDDKLWNRIKDGEYQAFSVGGRGNRRKIAT